ncbi:MAG TPA: hypothetical protein ACYCDB_00455 [Candidatus Azoamicus sp.]
MDVILAKNRNGPTGSIPFSFNGPTGKFDIIDVETLQKEATTCSPCKKNSPKKKLNKKTDGNNEDLKFRENEEEKDLDKKYDEKSNEFLKFHENEKKKSDNEVFGKKYNERLNLLEKIQNNENEISRLKKLEELKIWEKSNDI